MTKNVLTPLALLRYIEERNTNNALLWFRTCQYDLDGHILETVSMPTSPTNISEPEDALTYDADNRLSQWNGYQVTHDLNGNMTQGPLPNGTPDAIYAYDTSDRLTSAGGVASAYNPDGLRVTAGGASYKIDPNGLSKPLMRNQTKYVWGIGLIYEETGGEIKTYHPDHLGSTIMLCNANGAVTDTWAYTSYGMESHTQGISDTPFRFHGALGCMTDDNGLVYMRARYYNPRIMRFLNQDPIGFQGGLNWFAAFDNNPVSNVDPLGLCVSNSRYTWPSDQIAPIPNINPADPYWATATTNTGQNIAMAAGAIAIPAGTLGGGGATIPGEIIAAGSRFGLLGAMFAAMLTMPGDTQVKTNTQTREDIKTSTIVYRVWGGASGLLGQSWTTTDPRTDPEHYRELAGLPFVNTGQYLAIGVLIDTKGVLVYPAIPLDSSIGGSLGGWRFEVRVPSPGTQIRITDPMINLPPPINTLQLLLPGN